jgi:hypothetical protein
MTIIPRSGGWGSIVSILNQNFSEIESILSSINSEVNMCQGLFPNTSVLLSSVQNPQVGYWAIIGETLPGNLWVFNNLKTWENLGPSPLNPDISNYPESEMITSATDIL